MVHVELLTNLEEISLTIISSSPEVDGDIDQIFLKLYLFLYEAWALITQKVRKDVGEQIVKKNIWNKEIMNNKVVELLNCFAVIVLFTYCCRGD